MIGDALKVLQRPPSGAVADIEPMLQVNGLHAGSAREV
jgi:hypothetical protein